MFELWWGPTAWKACAYIGACVSAPGSISFTLHEAESDHWHVSSCEIPHSASPFPAHAWNARPLINVATPTEVDALLTTLFESTVTKGRFVPPSTTFMPGGA